MSYTLNKSDGTILVTLEDGTSDSNTSSLTFVGQNYVGYGEILQENLVRLLENFSKNVEPRSPLTGQLWWDTSTNLLKVRANNTWKAIACSIASPSSPSNANVGDFWFDTTKDQVKVWTGNSWIIVGPSFERGQDTIANALVVTDTLTNSHIVMTFYINGQIRYIFNPDLDFTPQSIIPGFSTLKQGFNLASTIAGTTYHGTAQNAITLQTLVPGDFLRSGQNITIGGNLLVDSDAGIWVGSGGKFRTTIDSLTGDTLLRTRTNGAKLTIAGTDNNTQVNYLVSDPATGLLTIAGDPTAAYGIASKNYVDTNINSVASVLRNDIDSNVIAINSALGTLTTEINNVNTYALNLNSTKANIISAEFSGVPKAPTRAITTSNTAIATTAFVHNILPYGCIVMWSGSVVSIPNGWNLCDGTNGTPDLRNRFIVGAGDLYNPTSIGGNTSLSVTTTLAGTHSHSGSTGSTSLSIAQMPAHTHTSGTSVIRPSIGGYPLHNAYNSSAGTGTVTIDSTGGGQGHLHSISADGGHTHSVTVQPILPPYYALCFIMKVV